MGPGVVARHHVTPVPAQMRHGPHWFAGSADAIFQNLNLIDDDRPDYVLVFGAGHIYRMDPRQMVERHIASGAGVTMAATRVPITQAGSFGVIEVDGDRISSFQEKPSRPVDLADNPAEVFASMGNYCFSTSALVEALRFDAANKASRHDVGGDIIPVLVEAGVASAYDFVTNEIPGATERDSPIPREALTVEFAPQPAALYPGSNVMNSARVTFPQVRVG
jgi:glucose-1-phosphate adenylyltransferase